MTRLSILAMQFLVWPIIAISDTSAQRIAAVDQMSNACITDVTHPEHYSDLCVAFVYGTYYQARFQRPIPIPGLPTSSGGQNLVRLPELIDRLLSTDPEVRADSGIVDIPSQQMAPVEQELAPGPSEVFIMPMPQSGSGGSFDPGSFGQIVR